MTNESGNTQLMNSHDVRMIDANNINKRAIS